MIPNLAENAYTSIGLDRGFYRDEGIDLEIQDIVSGVAQIKAVLSGEIDVGDFSPSPIFPAIEQGGDLILIGTSKPRLNTILFAQPEFPTLESLQGRTIGVGPLGTFAHQLGVALAIVHGLDPDSFKWVNIGVSPDVFKALQVRKVDGGISNLEFLPIAQRDGTPSAIVHLARDLSSYLRFGFGARRSDVEARPDVYSRFITAVARSQRYALTNADAVVSYAVKTMSRDRSDMEFLHDYSVKNRIISDTGRIDPKAIQFTQEMNVRAKSQQAVLPFERVATNEFAQHALDMLGPFKWPA